MKNRLLEILLLLNIVILTFVATSTVDTTHDLLVEVRDLLEAQSVDSTVTDAPDNESIKVLEWEDGNWKIYESVPNGVQVYSATLVPDWK